MAVRREIKKRVYPSDSKPGFILESLHDGKLPHWMRFKDVDVWQKTFSEYSSLAIIDVYSQKFDVTFIEARRLKFTDCVEALRKLEDPTYVCWKDR